MVCPLSCRFTPSSLMKLHRTVTASPRRFPWPCSAAFTMAIEAAWKWPCLGFFPGEIKSCLIWVLAWNSVCFTSKALARSLRATQTLCHSLQPLSQKGHLGQNPSVSHVLYRLSIVGFVAAGTSAKAGYTLDWSGNDYSSSLIKSITNNDGGNFSIIEASFNSFYSSYAAPLVFLHGRSLVTH